MIEATRRRRLFGQHSTRMRTLPFLLVLCLAFALGPLDADGRYPLEQWLSAGLALATVAAIALLPWRRLPPIAALMPLLLYLATAALLRDSHGGSLSGYAPLVLVPVLWAGAFGRWRDLAAVAVAAGLTLGLPIALVGGPDYPTAETRRALLTTLIGLTAAAGISFLLRALAAEIDRREAIERKLERLTADEVHDDIVQSLTVAQLALALDNRGAAESATTHALRAAQHVVAKMLSASGATAQPGTHRRDRPAPHPLR